MARLARRKRTLKVPKNKKGKKEELAKKRGFSHQVRFERAMLKAAKHGPKPNALIEMAPSRRSMTAVLAGSDYRLSKYAVSVAVDATVALMGRVARRASLLLHYAKKRKADEATMKMAICDVMATCGYLGVDMATMPQFAYKPGMWCFVLPKGRTTASKLAEQFEAAQLCS